MLLSGALCCAGAPLVGGCVHGGAVRTESSMGGYRVAPADPDPEVVNRAPRVLYGGDWAYLVDGKWYTAGDRGWVVFVEEPPELHRQRDAITTEQPPTNALVPRGPEISQTGAPELPDRFPGP